MSLASRRFQRATQGGGVPPSGNNLLVDKVFSSSVGDSTSEPGNPVGNATDQDDTTRWISLPASPVNLTVDLEAVYDLSKVTVVWAADTIRNFQIQVSTNGSTWTTIVTGETNNTQKQTVDYTSFSNTPRGQYMRIVGVDRWNGSYGNSIWEVMAYGTYVSPGAASGTLSNFTATAAGSTGMNLAWQYSGSTLSGLTLSRDSTPIQTLPGTATSFSDTGLTASTTYNYSLTGTYALNGQATNTVNTSGTTGAAGGGGGFFSGLPFASLLFKSNGSLSTATSFGNSRGRPVDGVMQFATYSGTWNDLRWVQPGMASYVASGGMFIFAMPHAPSTEGSAMNQNGANNTYAAQQTAFAQWFAAQGLNHPNVVIRLDWEFNGSWYPWSAWNATHLRQAIIHCINNFRAGGLTQVKFDLCANKGTHSNGLDLVFPGAQYIDIVSTDHYDMGPPAYDDSGWNSQQSQHGSLQYVVNFARQYGIQWALDEGGAVHVMGDPYYGGGDNVYYWQKVWEFINANLYDCHHHVTYDDAGAPNTLKHDFASNPNSWNYYRRTDRWGG